MTSLSMADGLGPAETLDAPVPLINAPWHVGRSLLDGNPSGILVLAVQDCEYSA